MRRSRNTCTEGKLFCEMPCRTRSARLFLQFRGLVKEGGQKKSCRHAQKITKFAAPPEKATKANDANKQTMPREPEAAVKRL